MSLSPHCAHMRAGTKMGPLELVDTMIKDGLWDAFNGYHMGTTAENVAKEWQITRADQDAFAALSQQKAEAAIKAGRFKDEITPVTVKTRKGEIVIDTDEHPKARHHRRGAGQTPPGIQQGRQCHRRQRVGHQ